MFRLLGLDGDKWARIDPGSVWSASAIAVGASAVLALNRFGGIVVDAPRSFVRLALVGVWGWLGLAVTLVLAASLARRRFVADPGELRHTVVLVGMAHLSILVLGLVVFVAAGLLQWLGPGLVFAFFTFGFWFPASLVMAVRQVAALDLIRSVVVTAVPYLLWLVVVGRHLIGQIQHLL